MSEKKNKENRKNEQPSSLQPRSSEVINQEYSDLVSKCGQATLQIKDLEFGIEGMFRRVGQLAQEMQAREAIQASEKAASTEVKEQTTGSGN